MNPGAVDRITTPVICTSYRFCSQQLLLLWKGTYRVYDARINLRISQYLSDALLQFVRTYTSNDTHALSLSLFLLLFLSFFLSLLSLCVHFVTIPFAAVSTPTIPIIIIIAYRNRRCSNYKVCRCWMHKLHRQMMLYIYP